MHTTGVYGELNVRPHWYALHTRSRHEKKVDLRLKEKGLNSYLPLNTVYRRWSDRHQAVQEPLFSCYVFVFIALRDRLSVLQTEGAVNLVSFCGIPAWIPEEQIDAVKQVLQSKPSVEIANAFAPGQKVRIKHGPLTGLAGTLITHKNNHRVIIAIEAINQAIAVEIDPCELERLAA
ncbi:MAG: UpxY family transcription antiterminator [bacterium]